MKLIENLKGYFKQEEKEETKQEPKKINTKGEATVFVDPVFNEVAPSHNQDKYLTEGVRSWAFIAMSAIADEICTNPVKLLDKKTKKEVGTHPVLELINNPNKLQTKEEFLWTVSVMLLAGGEVPILVDFPKEPKEMVVLNPSRLKVFFTDGEVKKYKYRMDSGTDREIEEEKIIFIKLPNILTPVRGKGVLSYIVQTLDIDYFIDEYLRLFFYNDATPRGVLETDQKLDQDILTRLKEQFKRLYQGVRNSNKMAILEKGLKFKPISAGFSDAFSDQVNSAIRDKIFAAFKVPKSIVGITVDSSRANGSNDNIVFSRRAVKPKLIMIQSELNQFLLPMFSGTENKELIFENPVIEDRKIEAEIHSIYVTSGVMSIEEVRDELGLKKDAQRETPKDEPKKEEPKKIVKGEKRDVIADLIADLVKEDMVYKEVFTKDELDRYHKEKVVFSEAVELEFKDKLIKYFGKLENRYVKKLNNKSLKSIKQQEDILDLTKLEIEIEAKEMERLAEPYMMKALLRQSSLTFALIGVDDRFNSTDSFVKEFIKTSTLKLGKSTSETTRLNVESILKKWNEADGTTRDLRKSLRFYFGNAQKTRSETIARTEISRSAGFATNEVYKKTGAVGKTWITAKDERVCQFCSLMDGKTIPINRNFWNSSDDMVGAELGKLSFDFGSIANYPLHPQCRCDLIPVYSTREIPRNPFSYKKDSKKRNVKRDEQKEKEITLDNKIEETKRIKNKLSKDMHTLFNEKKEYRDEAKNLKEELNKINKVLDEEGLKKIKTKD